MYKRFSDIPAVFIDGFIICALSYFTFSQVYFSGDDAAKYIDPMLKFYINYIFGGLAIVFATLKSFRSNTFSEHQAEKKKLSDQTAFITKP